MLLFQLLLYDTTELGFEIFVVRHTVFSSSDTKSYIKMLTDPFLKRWPCMFLLEPSKTVLSLVTDSNVNSNLVYGNFSKHIICIYFTENCINQEKVYSNLLANFIDCINSMICIRKGRQDIKKFPYRIWLTPVKSKINHYFWYPVKMYAEKEGSSVAWLKCQTCPLITAINYFMCLKKIKTPI